MAGFDRPDAPNTRDPDAPQWEPTENLGNLLVLQVQDVRWDVETEYGTRECIVADVHVISGGRIAQTYEGAWLFGTVLFSQLREKKGRTVLGVLEQGEKKPGKKPPWRLADATDAQEETAIRAMASKPDPGEDRQPATAGASADGKAPWE